MRAVMTMLICLSAALAMGCVEQRRSSPACQAEGVEELAFREQQGYRLLARGTITRTEEERTENSTFQATSGTRMFLTLRAYEGEDGPAPLLGCAQKAGEEIEFPMDYELWVPDTLQDPEWGLLVSVYVHRQWRGEDKLVVSDLLSEQRNHLLPRDASEDGTHQLDIKISGIEHCDSPNAGGFCTRETAP